MNRSKHLKTTSALIGGAAAAALAASISPAAADDDEKWNILDKGAPQIEYGEGKHFKVRGRLQWDYTVADVDFGGPLDDSYSGSELRRGRLGIEGQDGRISYKAEVTFSEGDAEWEDAYVELDFGAVALLVGQFKEAVSLNEQTSSRHINSLERASFTDAFDFMRRAGVGIAMGGDNYSFKAGVYGDNINDDTGTEDETYAAAARLTFQPINEKGHVAHVGGSVRYRDSADGGDFRYRVRPLIHIADRFVDTGSFAESDLFVGGEAAYINGPFHIAGEYGYLDAEPSGLGDGGSFQGGYIEAGYFLTQGDSRGWKGDVFDRTKPQRSFNSGGPGAWEIRGRVDYMDLQDGDFAGGEQTGFTVGLNWYAANYLRFLGEYSYVDISDSSGINGLDGEVNAFSLRAQIDW